MPLAPNSHLATLLLLGLALPFAAPSADAAAQAMIRYHVTLNQVHAHRVHVTLTIDGIASDHVEVAMPVWTPGSYLVREYARHVLDLRAASPDGTPLDVSKVAKNSWHIASGGHASLTVDYDLYANELSVRTNHADADHALLMPAAAFPFVRDRTAEPHHVTVDTPSGWDVFTGLPRDGDGWRADDYDVLVDSPVEIGPHRELTFDLEGVPHRIVLAGEGPVDADKLASDVRLVAAEIASIFGLMPFDDYTFILLLTDKRGGGLEHRNSNVSMVSRWDLSKPDKYRELLSLLAHEYFHAWNVKRFRPEALGPFDYETENYTPDLWVAEGVTSYYDDLATLRAGFAEKVDAYLTDRAAAFRSEAERPGSQRMSLTESSRDAWVKLYRPDENSINSAVSYYSKGALVALLLDLRIRRLTDGERTLADVLRLGWERYTNRGVGFPEGAVEELASEVADTDLGGFFAEYVDGTAPLQPDVDLAWVGLRLLVEPATEDRDLPKDADGFPLEPSLAITVKKNGEGLCRIDTVHESGPAFRAGLNHDDLILAVDGMRVSADTLRDRLDRVAGNGAVTVTFYRGQSLRTVEVTPDERRVATWKISPVEDPTEAQRARFRTWTNWDLPGETTARDE